MKYLIFTTILVLGISVIRAQSPDKISYQAIIHDQTGKVITNKIISLKISILQGSSSGSISYSETHPPLTNSFGLINIEIGNGNEKNGNFGNIDWASGPYFIRTEIDPAGGTNYNIVGTSQLLSVPYAKYADKAGNGFSGSYADLSNKPTLFSGSYKNLTDTPSLFSGSFNDLTSKPTTIAGYGITDAVTISENQTITGIKTFSNGIIGDVNANNKVVSNVAKPVANNDAATKAYVDSLYKRILLNMTDVSVLLAAGVTIQELLDAGRTLQDLFNAHVSKSQLYGLKYKGGLIFYIDSTACTGLVCAENNLPGSAPWGCQGTVIPGADGKLIGTGKQNTIDIVNNCGSTTAAKLCYDLVLNGYDDWFLPAYNESIEMYRNLYKKGKGNFAYTDYCWTSTEWENGADYGCNLVIFVFDSQGISGNWKNEAYKVRAVREF